MSVENPQLTYHELQQSTPFFRRRVGDFTISGFNGNTQILEIEMSQEQDNGNHILSINNGKKLVPEQRVVRLRRNGHGTFDLNSDVENFTCEEYLIDPETNVASLHRLFIGNAQNREPFSIIHPGFEFPRQLTWSKLQELSGNKQPWFDRKTLERSVGPNTSHKLWMDIDVAQTILSAQSLTDEKIYQDPVVRVY